MRRASLIEGLESRHLFSALTLTTLSTFTSGTPVPASTIAIDSSGDLFGTDSGGSTGDGYVWVLRKVGGTYEANSIILASFPADGSFGNSTRDGLVIDSQGNLFGTNYDGYTPFTTANVGTLWELPKTATGYGSLTLLKAFTDLGGQNPDGMLSVDASDNIFGTADSATDETGPTGAHASVFEYSAAGGYRSLVNFDDLSVGGPESNLVKDAEGNLYGTVINGGATSAGAVFEVPAGQSAINIIASFNSVNSNPFGQLSIINNGSSSELFGVGEGDEAGYTNTGDLWELPITNGAAGELTTLGTFNGANGNNPSGGTFLAPDGNLYGTASASGTPSTYTPTVWESVDTAGTFGAPQTVATFAANSGTYPVSGLLSDGTNLFGVTTSLDSVNGGTIFGAGPATIPSGGGTTTPTATAYLLPTVTRSTVPTTAVGGKPIKGTINVTVTNETSGIEKGKATVAIDAYDGTSFFLLGSEKLEVNLKPGKSAPFRINVKGSLSAGSYSLVPYSYDTANNVTAPTTAPALQVNAPFVALAAAITAVKPATIKLGKTGAFSITIANTGNVPATGPATINIGLSIDGVTTAIALPALTHAYTIAPGRKLVLHLRIPVAKTMTPGSYFPIVDYTQAGITATVTGAIPFAVAG